jgi:hypothetical protein
MKRAFDKQAGIIDLGAVSVATKGAPGVPSIDTLGARPMTGLTKD